MIIRILDEILKAKQRILSESGLPNSVDVRMLEALEWNLLAKRERWAAHIGDGYEFTNTKYRGEYGPESIFSFAGSAIVYIAEEDSYSEGGPVFGGGASEFGHMSRSVTVYSKYRLAIVLDEKGKQATKKTEFVYWRDPSLPAGYDVPVESSDEEPGEEAWPDDEDRYLGGFFD